MSALLHTSMVVLIAAAAVMGLLVMAIVIVDSVKTNKKLGQHIAGPFLQP